MKMSLARISQSKQTTKLGYAPQRPLVPHTEKGVPDTLTNYYNSASKAKYDDIEYGSRKLPYKVQTNKKSTTNQQQQP